MNDRIRLIDCRDGRTREAFSAAPQLSSSESPGTAYGLIEDIRRKKEVDFVTDFAYLLPLYVICWMMDMALQHRDLYQW